MNEKRVLDIGIILCGITCIILVYFYIEESYRRTGIMGTMALVALIYFITFVKDSSQYHSQYQPYATNGMGSGAISQIILLSEENTELTCWDIYGKTSIVFGRDEREHRMSMGNPIDVDLKDTAFAATVDLEHAVMNYYKGEWYLEDLESENGVSVQKAREMKYFPEEKHSREVKYFPEEKPSLEDKNATYRISPGSPCKIEKNDIIYLGLTKLKVR